MSVPEEATLVRYQGDGVTATFPVPYRFSGSGIAVYQKNAGGIQRKLQSGEYAVGSGGITVNTPPPEGAVIAINRESEFSQTSVFVNGGIIDAATLNGGFDKITMLCQELREELNRCIKVEVTGEFTDVHAILEEMRGLTSSAGGYASGAEAASSGAVAAENSASAYAAIAVGASAGAVNAKNTASNYMASAGGFAENASGYMTGAQTASSGAVVAENNASSAATGFYNFTGSALAALIGSANVDPLLRNPDAEGCASGLYYGFAVTPYSSGTEVGYKWADIVGEHDQDGSAHSVLFGGKISLPDPGVSSGCVFTANGSGSGAWLPQQGGGGGGGAVQSVNGKVGAVVLSAGDVGALPVSGGTVTGNVQAENVNITSGVNAGTVTGSTGSFNHLFLSDGADVTGDIVVNGIVSTKGEKLQVVTATSGTVTVPSVSGKVFVYEAVAGNHIAFANPAAGNSVEFELIVTMPDPAVTLVWDSLTAAPEIAAGQTKRLKFRGSNTGGSVEWEDVSPEDMSEYAKLSGAEFTGNVEIGNHDTGHAATLTVYGGAGWQTFRVQPQGDLLFQGRRFLFNCAGLPGQMAIPFGLSITTNNSDNLTINNHSSNTPGGFCISDATTGNITVPGACVSKGLYITPLTSLASITPQSGVVYTYTLSAAATVSFGTPTAGYCPTFELWLTMPATAVAVTFPDGILWDDGNGEFSASNPAPDLSAGSKVYHLVFRYDGADWLGNLAYTKAVAQ